MRFLHLTSSNTKSDFIKNIVENNSLHYTRYENDINKNLSILSDMDFILKDRYAFELNSKFWKETKKIISLIPAYLPHNRGTDSNLWSFIDATPKGGSIIYLYNSNYKMKIIHQFEIQFNTSETLKTSFEKIFSQLYSELANLLPQIVSKEVSTFEVSNKEGSTHTRIDSEPFLSWLPDGYDTEVSNIPKLWTTFNDKN